MASLHPAVSSRLSTSARWALSIGGVTFLCGLLPVILLGDIAYIASQYLGLPTEYSAYLIPAPAAVVGAVLWWGIIERRAWRTYVSGALFGLLTVLLTGIFWTLHLAVLGGLKWIQASAVLIGIFFLLSLPVGLVAGILVMGARRQRGAL